MNFQKLIKNATIEEQEIDIYRFENKETGQDEYLSLTYDTSRGKFIDLGYLEIPEKHLDEIERLILEHHSENREANFYNGDESIDDLVDSYKSTY